MSELWVIETWTGNRWAPCIDALGKIDASIKHQAAYRNERLWQEDNPGSRFRVSKYSAEAKPK